MPNIWICEHSGLDGVEKTQELARQESYKVFQNERNN